MLHIDDCQNWQRAGERVRIALAQVGDTITAVEFLLLSTPEETAAVPFAGSPTITLDGEDLFPGETGSSSPAALMPHPDWARACAHGSASNWSKRSRPMDADALTVCSCCGRELPRRKVHSLEGGAAYICRRCGMWVALWWRGDTH